MKRSFLEKIAERYKELETAARVYIELGGEDEEPLRAKRVLSLEASPLTRRSKAQPLLIVTKRKTGEEPPEKKRLGRPPKVDSKANGATEMVRRWFKSHPGASIVSGALMTHFSAKTKGQKQQIYNALYAMKKSGELRQDDAGAYAVVAKA